MEPERLRPRPQGPKFEQKPRRDLARPLDQEETGGDEVTQGGGSPSYVSSGELGNDGIRAGRTGTPRENRTRKVSKGPGKIVIAVLVALLVAVGYFLLGQGGSSKALASETESPAYQKHRLASPGARMSLSRADVNTQATKAAVEAAKAGQPIPGLTSASPELVNHIAAGEVEFYTVRAYDTCAEDGDWITINSSNGAKLGSVMMTNAGTTMTIPVVNGHLPELNLIADRDGVGGVTVGVQTSGGVWYSGVLAPGQMQPIPLTMH